MPRHIAKIWICFLLAALVTATSLIAGCRPQATTSAATTAKPTTSVTQTLPPPTTAVTTAATTTAATSAETTTESSSETTGSETGSEPSYTEPATFFQPLAADQVQMADLNDDGRKEQILYHTLDDFSFNLTLNGETIRHEGSNFLTSWFFLVDLDQGDHLIDLAIQELGPSDDYQVVFYFYNGNRLVWRGTVPGMICDPYSATIASDPYGLGNIMLDNSGGLVALARGAVLHTWFYEEPWQIGSDKLLDRIDRRYDPMQSEDPLTGERKPETPVTMKRDLPLVAQPGSSEVAAIARLGQNASLVQTDNQSWVQLRTESGVLGWFQLQDFFMVLIDGQAFFGDDVFDGLNMAD